MHILGVALFRSRRKFYRAIQELRRLVNQPRLRLDEDQGFQWPEDWDVSNLSEQGRFGRFRA